MKNYNRKIKIGRKTVGEVRGGTFFKRITGSKHFLRVPPAIAFDISSLEEAEAVGAQNVDVLDEETGQKYFSSIRNIREKGFVIDRGFGHQLALPLSYWRLDDESEIIDSWG